MIRIGIVTVSDGQPGGIRDLAAGDSGLPEGNARFTMGSRGPVHSG